MIERIAFDHIIAKLDSQRADINSIRSQASISAAVTGLVAAVFSSMTSEAFLEEKFFGDAFWGLSLPAISLILIFGGAIVMSSFVLTRFSDFNFSFNALTMLKMKCELATEENFFEQYVKDGEWYFEDNETKIIGAQNYLWYSSVLGYFQILPWLLLIIGD